MAAHTLPRQSRDRATEPLVEPVPAARHNASEPEVRDTVGPRLVAGMFVRAKAPPKAVEAAPVAVIEDPAPAIEIVEAGWLLVVGMVSRDGRETYFVKNERTGSVLEYLRDSESERTVVEIEDKCIVVREGDAFYRVRR